MMESETQHGMTHHVEPDPHAPRFGTPLAGSHARHIGLAAQSLFGSIIVPGVIIVAPNADRCKPISDSRPPSLR